MSAGDELLDLLAQRYSVGPKDLAPPGPSSEPWARAGELALRAPDHGGLMPFRFVVVGDSQREALGGASEGGCRGITRHPCLAGRASLAR